MWQCAEIFEKHLLIIKPNDDDHVRPNHRDPAHRAEIPQIDLKFFTYLLQALQSQREMGSVSWRSTMLARTALGAATAGRVGQSAHMTSLSVKRQQYQSNGGSNVRCA
jgi:hypothetical protein